MKMFKNTEVHMCKKNADKAKFDCIEKINDDFKCEILRRILFRDCSAQISVNRSELKPVQFLSIFT